MHISNENLTQLTSKVTQEIYIKLEMFDIQFNMKLKFFDKKD